MPFDGIEFTGKSRLGSVRTVLSNHAITRQLYVGESFKHYSESRITLRTKMVLYVGHILRNHSWLFLYADRILHAWLALSL